MRHRFPPSKPHQTMGVYVPTNSIQLLMVKRLGSSPLRCLHNKQTMRSQIFFFLRVGIPTPPPRDHNHQRWPLRNRHTTAITRLALHPAAGTPVLTGTLTHVFSLKKVNYPYNKVHAGHQPSSNDSRMWILSFDIYFLASSEDRAAKGSAKDNLLKDNQ